MQSKHKAAHDELTLFVTYLLIFLQNFVNKFDITVNYMLTSYL